MAYVANFIKLTALGQLAGTDEVFSFGFSVGMPGGVDVGTFNDFRAILPDVAEEIRNFFGGQNNGVPNKWQLTSVKAALIGTDGKYFVDQAPEEYVFASPVPGAANQATAPQLSAVVTLQSEKFKDPGKYNRFYLPTVGTTENTLVMEGFRPEYIATAAAQMFVNIRILLIGVNTELNIFVVSSSGTGWQRPLKIVKVGNVIDTQRRRRNKIPESYFTVEYNPT